MDPIKGLCMEIVGTLSIKDVSDINTPLKAIDFSCDIVEKAYKNLKNKAIKWTPMYKKQLAGEILKAVINRCRHLGAIDENLYNKMNEFTKAENIEYTYELIDDIVNIWNKYGKKTLTRCFPKLSCFRKNKNPEEIETPQIEIKKTIETVSL